MEDTEIKSAENIEEDIYNKLYNLQLHVDYSSSVINGQKIIGPPYIWSGPEPAKGSELYISNLPRECLEDQLFEIFKEVAPIYKIRLMFNFDGTSRGYAFISYFTALNAWQALTRFNNYEIRKGRRISVVKSFDNRMVYIGGIPKDKTKADAWIEVYKVCPNLKDIIMYFNCKNSKKNRGFLFIEFGSHRDAAIARRNMLENRITLWGSPVYVNWAQQELDVDLKTMFTTTKIFIKNLTAKYNKERMYDLLTTMVPSSAIKHIFVAGQFGFIHLNNRKNAEIVKEGLSLFCLNGEMLEVHWARPYRPPVAKNTTPLATSTYNLSITRKQISESSSSTSSSSVDTEESFEDILEDENIQVTPCINNVEENKANNYEYLLMNNDQQYEHGSNNEFQFQNNLIENIMNVPENYVEQDQNYQCQRSDSNKSYILLPNTVNQNCQQILLPNNDMEQMVLNQDVSNNFWVRNDQIHLSNTEDQNDLPHNDTEVQNHGFRILDNSNHPELYQDYRHQYIPLPTEGYQNMHVEESIRMQYTQNPSTQGNYNPQIQENFLPQLNNPTYEIDQAANNEYLFPENNTYFQYPNMQLYFHNMQISNDLMQNYSLNVQNVQQNNLDFGGFGETHNNNNY